MAIIRKIFAIIGIGGLVGGLFFLSTNLTGYAVSNLTQVATNIVGGSLFVAGIIGNYLWFRKRLKDGV